MFNDVILDHFRNPHNAGDLLRTPPPPSKSPIPSAVTFYVYPFASMPAASPPLASKLKVVSPLLLPAPFSPTSSSANLPPNSASIAPQEISAALGGLPPATFHAAQLCTDAVAALLKKFP